MRICGSSARECCEFQLGYIGHKRVIWAAFGLENVRGLNLISKCKGYSRLKRLLLRSGGRPLLKLDNYAKQISVSCPWEKITGKYFSDAESSNSTRQTTLQPKLAQRDYGMPFRVPHKSGIHRLACKSMAHRVKLRV